MSMTVDPSVPTAGESLRVVVDAIYLACALDGGAQVLTSNDATLLGLGSPYAGVRIVPWQAFVEALRARGLIISDTCL
jgi:predicted nucleic acid-binding protein